jgi:hypothetical protein
MVKTTHKFRRIVKNIGLGSIKKIQNFYGCKRMYSSKMGSFTKSLRSIAQKKDRYSTKMLKTTPFCGYVPSNPSKQKRVTLVFWKKKGVLKKSCST